MLGKKTCWALDGLHQNGLDHFWLANRLMPELESQSVILVVELRNLVHESFVENFVVKQLQEALENHREGWVVHPCCACSPVTELKY